MIGGVTLDGEEADVGVVGRLDFVVGVFGEPERQAHVRLAAAEPDVADENVVQLDGLMAGDLHGIRSAGRGGSIFTCQRRSAPAVPVAVLSPICTRTVSPGSDQPQMVSGLPRCSTMLSPKMGLTNGRDLVVADGIRLTGRWLRECAQFRDDQQGRRCNCDAHRSTNHDCEPLGFIVRCYWHRKLRASNAVPDYPAQSLCRYRKPGER